MEGWTGLVKPCPTCEALQLIPAFSGRRSHLEVWRADPHAISAVGSGRRCQLSARGTVWPTATRGAPLIPSWKVGPPPLPHNFNSGNSIPFDCELSDQGFRQTLLGFMQETLALLQESSSRLGLSGHRELRAFSASP